MQIHDTPNKIAQLLTPSQQERLSRPCYFFGIDLGQISDFSTFVVLERHGRNREDYEFHCRDLYRWPLRTSYPEIVRDAVKWVNNSAFSDSENVSQKPVLAIDRTGVGGAVADLFRAEEINGKLIPISITAGSSVNIDAESTKVPKRELCGAIAVALQSDKLKFAQQHPLTPLLRTELENFRAKISSSGNTSFGVADDWRTGANDDLVLALSMALWCGMNEVKPSIFYSF